MNQSGVRKRPMVGEYCRAPTLAEAAGQNEDFARLRDRRDWPLA